MSTETVRTVYQLDLSGNAKEKIDALEKSLKSNVETWGKQAARLKEVKTQGDELLDSLKALGRRGNEAAAAIEMISDPAKRAARAQAELTRQLAGKDGLTKAAGGLEDQIHSLVAGFKGMPVPMQAAAAGGIAVVGAAALGAAAAIKSFLEGALRVAFEASPAMQISAGELRREYEGLQKTLGRAILSGVDLDEVYQTISESIQDATKWVKENEDTIRDVVAVIGDFGQVAAYVFSVGIPLALTPLLATIDALNLGFKLWAAGASTALNLVVQGLNYLGVVSDETAAAMDRINEQAIKDVKEFESLTASAWEAGGSVRDFGDKLAEVTGGAKKAADAIGDKLLAAAFRDLNDRVAQLDDEIKAEHIGAIEEMAKSYVKAGADVGILQAALKDIQQGVIDGTITAQQAKESFEGLFDAAFGGGSATKRRGGGVGSVAEEQAARWRDLSVKVARDRMAIEIEIENSLDEFRRKRADENEAFRLEYLEREKQQEIEAFNAIEEYKRERLREEEERTLALKRRMVDLQKETSEAIINAVGQAAIATGKLVGSMAAGATTMKQFKASMVQTVSEMSLTIAKHFIKIAAAWVAFQTGNPLLGLATALALEALASAGASAIASVGQDSSRSADRAQSAARESRDERQAAGDRERPVIVLKNYIGTREIAGEIRDMQERGLIA